MSAGGHRWLPWAGAGAALAILYAGLSFAFARGTDLPASPLNAFYDIDVARVIQDWTTAEPADRVRVHPLYKLVALAGIPLAHRLGDPTWAVRLICMAGVALQAVLAGLLVRALGGNDKRSCMAVAMAGLSFCSMLMVAVPDSAALSGLASLLPYLLWANRRDKDLTRSEGAAWAALLVFSYGVTISQLIHPAIALAFRLRGTRGTAKPVAAIVLAAGLIAFAGLRLQSALFPGTERSYRLDKIVAREFKFFETDELQQAPVRRLLRVVGHGLVAHAFPPEPIIAEWSPPRETRTFRSITFVESTPLSYGWMRGGVLLLGLALIATAGIDWRRIPLPLVLGIVAQGAMHFVYGREFIIYAMNWNGLLVAVLCLAVRRPRWPAAAVIVLIAAALLNVHTLHRTFELYWLK